MWREFLKDPARFSDLQVEMETHEIELFQWLHKTGDNGSISLPDINIFLAWH